MKTMILLTLAMTVIFSGCRKVPQTVLSEDQVKELVSGKYIGEYNNGRENFELRTNGTFSQTFVQNGVAQYSQEGVWTIEKLEDRHLIYFEPFMDQRDAIMAKGKSPEKVSACQATFYEDEPRIYFFRKINYFIVKPAGEKTNQVGP